MLKLIVKTKKRQLYRPRLISLPILIEILYCIFYLQYIFIKYFLKTYCINLLISSRPALHYARLAYGSFDLMHT